MRGRRGVGQAIEGTQMGEVVIVGMSIPMEGLAHDPGREVCRPGCRSGMYMSVIDTMM